MYMNSDGQSKKPGLNDRRKTFSAMATVASSSGRVSVCGRPNRKPHSRRIAASARIATSHTTRSRRPSSGGAGMIDQRLQRLGNLHVLLVAPLVEIQLLALDRIHARPRRR